MPVNIDPYYTRRLRNHSLAPLGAGAGMSVAEVILIAVLGSLAIISGWVVW